MQRLEELCVKNKDRGKYRKGEKRINRWREKREDLTLRIYRIKQRTYPASEFIESNKDLTLPPDL